MKPKGGRGNVAPYQTCMVRTPIPLKSQVEELIEQYREFVNSGGDPQNPTNLVDKPVDKLNSLVPFHILEEINELRSQLKQQEEELNQVHVLNGDLNLEVEELQLQLETYKAVDSLINSTTKPVDSLTQLDAKPVDDLRPLKAVELGQRLGYRDHSYVGRVKLKADFTDWSQGKDPDDIGWQYDAESKLFHPVK